MPYIIYVEFGEVDSWFFLCFFSVVCLFLPFLILHTISFLFLIYWCLTPPKFIPLAMCSDSKTFKWKLFQVWLLILRYIFEIFLDFDEDYWLWKLFCRSWNFKSALKMHQLQHPLLTNEGTYFFPFSFYFSYACVCDMVDYSNGRKYCYIFMLDATYFYHL